MKRSVHAQPAAFPVLTLVFAAGLGLAVPARPAGAARDVTPASAAAAVEDAAETTADLSPEAAELLASDPAEPDSCAAARPAADKTVAAGVINPSNDGDYWAIALVCGDSLRVDVTPNSGAFSAVAELFAPADAACASPLQSVIVSPFAGDGMPIALLRAVTAPGTYKVRVRSSGFQSAVGAVYAGPYTVSFSVTPGPCAAPPEPADADSCAACTLIKDGDVIRREIAPTGDGDFYCLDLTCGDAIYLAVTPTSATLRPEITRFAVTDAACTGTGTFVRAAANGQSVELAYANIFSSGDGLHRFRVRSSPTATTTGTYTLSVAKYRLSFCDPDAFEPGDNSRAGCRSLPAVGVPETHTTAPFDDSDWFCADLACGERMTLGTLPRHDGGRHSNTGLAVFDPSGSYLDGDSATGYVGLDRLRFAAPEAGTYSFVLRGTYITSNLRAVVGDYDLTVLARTPIDPLLGGAKQTTSPAGTLVEADPRTAASEYTKSVGANALLDISATGINLGLGDQTFAVLDLAFPFTYYDATYTQVKVTDNGMLTFEDDLLAQGNQFNPCPFPGDIVADPMSVIAPFWDSLVPSLSGSANVFVQTLGATPSRQLVVQWNQLPLAGLPLSAHTFEAILSEGSNEIEFRYGLLTGSLDSSGAGASIGIEDETGSRGVGHSCNQAGGAVTGQSLLFAPPSGTVPYPSFTRYVKTGDTAPLEDISATGTNLGLGDDTAVNVPLPFTFTFFGQPKTSVNVSSNGLLRFAPFGNDSGTPGGFPRSDGPNDFIAAFWDDLDASKGGGVFWQVDGAPGARRFITEWYQVPHFGTGGSHTFEVILHETTNVIELRYGTLAGAPESNGRLAAAGIESADGREGVGVSCRSAGILAEGVRFTFTGPQPFAPAFAWRDPDTDLLLSTDPAYFLPAAGRCDVRLGTDANDPLGLCPLTDSRLITVPDIAPPIVTPGYEDLHCVWPPNHKWVTFVHEDFAPVITDNCSPFSWVLSRCVSDDPGGGGSSDCVVATDGLSLALRAEKSGPDRDGRRYAIFAVATDSVGNQGGETLIGYVLVPHDQSDHPECIRPGQGSGRNVGVRARVGMGIGLPVSRSAAADTHGVTAGVTGEAKGE